MGTRVEGGPSPEAWSAPRTQRPGALSARVLPTKESGRGQFWRNTRRGDRRPSGARM